MAKLDFHKRFAADRMARKGVDRINDFGLPRGLTPPRKRTSKADARNELEKLMKNYNGKAAASGNATASKPTRKQNGKAI